jgi:hypothetical protein
MIDLTDQEVFNNALFGLRLQGKPCLQGTSCMYRHYKMRCAVGFSIDDKHYDTSFEDSGADDLVSRGVFPEDQQELLEAIQNAHDSTFKAQGKHDWECEMSTIAQAHALKYEES